MKDSEIILGWVIALTIGSLAAGAVELFIILLPVLLVMLILS